MPSSPPRLAALILAAHVLACNTRPGIHESELPPSALAAAGPTASGGWQSAPLPTPGQCEKDDGSGTEWIPIEGREVLDIPHGLGRAPSQVLVYIAFESRGCGGTLASGDVARISGADATHVRIENGTRESFSLRLYLE